MILPEYDARDLLAANVARLMLEHPDRGSARKLAAKSFWPATAGPKRRGKALSERYVRYVLNPVPDAAHSPSLDIITAIATAFGVQAWQLIVDDKQLRTWMVGKLFSSSDAATDAKVEAHYPLPPGEKSVPPKKRSGGE